MVVFSLASKILPNDFFPGMTNAVAELQFCVLIGASLIFCQEAGGNKSSLPPFVKGRNISEITNLKNLRRRGEKEKLFLPHDYFLRNQDLAAQPFRVKWLAYAFNVSLAGK